jgi:hypothetical protein
MNAREQSLRPGRQKNIMETTKSDRKFTNKAGIAAHFGVCRRTINEWMRLGLLVFFKIKRVVRFDIVACDESIRQNGGI